MEVEKRKRSDDREVDGKRKRVSEDNGRVPKATEDDEVEEFFAILRRIHEAVKYFEKGKGEGGRRELTSEGSTRWWSPSFEREDFEEVDGVKGPNGVENDAGLDLNADPEAEQSFS